VSWTIGYSVFTTKSFDVGDFLVEYRGNLVDEEEGNERLQRSSAGSYVYFLKLTVVILCGE